jgi:hypothetical protein
LRATAPAATGLIFLCLGIFKVELFDVYSGEYRQAVARIGPPSVVAALHPTLPPTLRALIDPETGCLDLGGWAQTHDVELQTWYALAAISTTSGSYVDGLLLTRLSPRFSLEPRPTHGIELVYRCSAGSCAAPWRCESADGEPCRVEHIAEQDYDLPQLHSIADPDACVCTHTTNGSLARFDQISSTLMHEPGPGGREACRAWLV